MYVEIINWCYLLMKMTTPVSGVAEAISRNAQNFIHPYVILSEPLDQAWDLRLRERRIPMMKLMNSLQHRDSSHLAALRMTTCHQQRMLIESELMDLLSS